MQNEKITLTTDERRKSDAEEMAELWIALPPAEQKKLFYMMKGIELMVSQTPEQKAI